MTSTRQASTAEHSFKGDSASEKSRGDHGDSQFGPSSSNDVEKNMPQPEQPPEPSNLVEWDGPQDPNNPQNFATARKCRITAVAALMTFVISFGSSVFSTATEVTAEEFGTSNEVMILGVSLYVLGFACGPLVWGPLSEAGYGRRTPLMAGFFGFLIFQIPVGVAQNLQTIFLCRFFAGAFGSSPLAIVAGMYVDFWDTVSRSVATMFYSAGVFAGPALGPIIGEFTVKNQSLGWRWTAWFTLIMGATVFAFALFIIPETHAPTLHQRKANRLRQETGNWALHSKSDEDPVHWKMLLMKYGIKPMRMLTQEPILIIFTLYMSLVYSILYLAFFAYPISFEYDRGIEFGVSSLPFVAIFIGVLIACAVMIFETKIIYTPKLVKAKKLIPEERLIPMFIGSPVLVVGLFWFAWTSFPSINPWPQIISGVFIGCGFVMVFMSGIIYLVDVYLFDANSALAANAFVRAAMAAGFPLFATPMYSKLGVQWATSLIGFLCLALLPAPFLFYKYGKRVRSWSKFAYDLG
ncbi:uncharacterized protein LTR77_007881 [Saxophila tyrrhenica]|uniref:Cercosporin MFS transporter CTB4 n=1 Tax=Saxophila tyrrhenica TaxID=1690608 RepID=A0AAV9P435_9PEZI|nr:hypothetical protein LTR77_007881 [Saxophila tyrrhenica]